MALLNVRERQILKGKNFIDFLGKNDISFRKLADPLLVIYQDYCKDQKVPCTGLVFVDLLQPWVADMGLFIDCLQSKMADIMDDNKRSSWVSMFTKLLVEKLYPQ